MHAWDRGGHIHINDNINDTIVPSSTSTSALCNLSSSLTALILATQLIDTKRFAPHHYHVARLQW
jgi:hypothetical protein